MENLNNFEMEHNSNIDERYHQFHIGNIGNVIYWMDIFSKVSQIEGDIVECGVGRGRSLVTISSINHFLSKEEGGKRKIFAYDSFEGFPEPSKEDASKRNPKKGEWSYSKSGKYKYSIAFTKEILKEAGVPFNENTLTIQKGYFCDSLKSHPKRKIAILHVDGDLYQSYIDILNNLFDLVEKGGIIVFDDFQAQEIKDERFPGARKAVNEFFCEKLDKLKVTLAGTYYFIKD